MRLGSGFIVYRPAQVTCLDPREPETVSAATERILVPVRLYPGMRIAQIVLQTMTSPAERPYGTERGSHYHGQLGPQTSRIELDD